jgi:toxin ParE1/3/4
VTFSVELSDEAKLDTDEIYEYILNQSSKSQADKIIDSFGKIFDGLAEFPERGNFPKELHDFGNTLYREAHFKPYRIIYRIIDTTVLVTCVFDGRRDRDKLLGRRLIR